MNHAQMLTVMFAAFTYTKLEDKKATLAAYLSVLGDIPPSEFELVCRQLMADGGHFLPAIADIRNKWYELTHVLNHPTEADAWHQVQLAIRKYGHGSKPEFEDEVVAKTVEQLGWRELCMSDKPGVDRAQFRDYYRANLERMGQLAKLLPDVREALDRKQLKGPRSMKELIDGQTRQLETSG